MYLSVGILLHLLSLVNSAPSELPDLTAAAQADLITDLPGLDFTTNYRQFSGYLDAGSDTFLHYWFVESQSDPGKSPLLLWLNGGPGCSSLDGLLTELGPIHVNNDGKTLYNNTNSWNQFASILFLESPACVGFSYNKNMNCSASDDSVSLNNYNAIKNFFGKYPSYRSNQFFVTGESYGGIYVPTLSVRIVENNASFPINFQGYAIGNGLSSYEMNDNSIIFFANYHGLLGKILWGSLVSQCCDSDIPSEQTCHFSGNPWPICQSKVSEAMNIIFNSGLNMYNLYDNCVHPAGSNELQQRVAFSRYHADKFNVHRDNKLLGGSQVQLDPPCTDSSAMSTYLNTPAVRKALHIPAEAPEWAICNDEVNANFGKLYKNMVAQYKVLHKAGVRGLVYNGDVDMACNFIGDQWFVESLGLKETASRREWHSGGQVAGFLKRFDLLDLLTIRGSGHMVPQDKPLPAYDMIKAFVMKTNY